MNEDIDKFKQLVSLAAIKFNEIDKNETIKVVSHLDADGISAASIILKLLVLQGRNCVLSILPQLNYKLLLEIAKENYKVFIFTDLGAGMINHITDVLSNRKVFVLDHHQPSHTNNGEVIQVNPHLVEIDGSNNISGAGVSYFFAREIDSRIKRMSHIALLGAIGDIQENNGFSSLNSEIVNDAVANGIIRVEKSIRFFGYQNRPLHKVLEYCNDPLIPGVSGNEQGAIDFLNEIGIYNKEVTSKKLSELNQREIDKLALGIIEKRKNEEKPEDILWNTYIIKNEENLNLKDLREFSTILNACGRLGKPGIGIGACLGDQDMKKAAIECLYVYKKEIMKAFDWIKNNKNSKNVIEREGFIIINAQDNVLGTIIGTIASVISKSKETKEGTLVMSMAHLVEGTIKVSLRISGKENYEECDMREILKQIVTKTQAGEYGGHKNAAGALIPLEKEEEFIKNSIEILQKISLEEGIC